MTALQQWQNADHGAVLLPEDGLPHDAQHLLTALGAVHAGDHETLSALCDDPTAHPLLTAALAIATATASAVPVPDPPAPDDPDAPWWHLLRGWALQRQGLRWDARHTEHAAATRPALYAAVQLLTDNGAEFYSSPILKAVSARANAAQLAARAVQVSGHVGALKDHPDTDAALFPLFDDQWPSLHAEPAAGDLQAWATTRRAWTTHDEATVGGLTGASQQGEALNLLLARLRRDVARGRLHGLTRPALAALHLAGAVGADAHTAVLARLVLGLAWFDGSIVAERLVPLLWLWHHLRATHSQDAGCAVVADALVAQLTPQTVRGPGLTALAAALAKQPVEDAGNLLLRLGLSVPPSDLVAALNEAGATKDRLRALTAMHAAGVGHLQAALMGVAPLLAEGHTATVRQIFGVVSMVGRRQGGLTPEVEAGLQAATAAVAEHGGDARIWALLLSDPLLAPAAGPTPHNAARHHACPPRADATAEEVVSNLWLAHHLQQPIGPCVRAIGRRLRSLDQALSGEGALDGAPEQDGTRFALTLTGLLFARHPELVEHYAEGPFRPVHRYLLRDDAKPLAEAVAALPAEGPVLMGAVSWFAATGQDDAPTVPWHTAVLNLLGVPAALRHPSHGLQTLLDDIGLPRLRNLGALGQAAQTLVHAARQAHAQRVAAGQVTADSRPPQLPLPDALLRAPWKLDDARLPVHEVVHVNDEGSPVQDPWKALDLDPDAPHQHSEDAVRSAWRAKVALHPPERDPVGARRVLDARDRLLRPDGVFARYLGQLPLPPLVGEAVPDSAGAETRLMAQVILYALAERALWNDGWQDAVQDAIAAQRPSEDAPDHAEPT